MLSVSVLGFHSFLSHSFGPVSYQFYPPVSLHLPPASLTTPSSNLSFLMKHVGKRTQASRDDNIQTGTMPGILQLLKIGFKILST